MIARVAVVPHPPILVPEVAAGAAGETAALRAACLLAAGAPARTAHCRRLGAELGQRLCREGGAVGLLVLGDGAATHIYSDALYGVAYHVALWDAVEQDPLP